MAESYDEPSRTKGNSKSYTANARAPRGDEIDEPTGAVASDSLANESIQSGGGFSQNANPEVLGVKGGNSTLANTNTSGARRLDPADDAETRDGDRFTSTDYPSRNTGGQGPGSGRDYDETLAQRGVYNTLRNTADGGNAPTYAENAAGHLRSEGELRPKGRGLVEDEGIPANRPTYTGDVGGGKDPGRLAEARFQLNDAASGNDAGIPRDTRVDNDNAFDALNSSERA